MSIGLWQEYSNVIITILDIIHRSGLFLKSFGEWILFPKHNVLNKIQDDG
jgi:hypothetical protein